jgi:hypothetical protein
MKLRKMMFNLGFVFLALVFALGTIGATSQTVKNKNTVSQISVSNYLEAQKNDNLSEEEKIKSAINAYFTTRYEGQKLLSQEDFSPLLEDNTLDWVKKEQDKREIELYIASLFKLNYQSYEFSLDYDSIKIENDHATVILRESHQVVFKAIAPEVSKMGYLQHEFSLSNKNGKWVIVTDQYEDELSQALDSKSKGELLKQVDENYQLELDVEANSKSVSYAKQKPLAAPSLRPRRLTSYSYDRTTAWQYADYYYNDTTYTPYYRMDPSGNDCANFVSQAINAGLTSSSPTTVPVSTFFGSLGTYPPGDSNWSQQWYYKFNTYASQPLAYSGSYAWIHTEGQYNFITTNNWTKGPYGSSVTIYNVSVADVVQIQINNSYDHEGIVVNIINWPPTLSNYLIDAHTSPRYHYPLSNWAAYPMRFIHISGGYR